MENNTNLNNQTEQTTAYTNEAYSAPAIEPVKDNSKGFAVASLILGISSVCCCGSITAILGLIFGIVSKSKKRENNGMATAGIILSAIGIALGIVYLIFVISGAAATIYESMGYSSLY